MRDGGALQAEPLSRPSSCAVMELYCLQQAAWLVGMHCGYVCDMCEGGADLQAELLALQCLVRLSCLRCSAWWRGVLHAQHDFYSIRAPEATCNVARGLRDDPDDGLGPSLSQGRGREFTKWRWGFFSCC
jgi:hypothetical protein